MRLAIIIKMKSHAETQPTPTTSPSPPTCAGTHAEAPTPPPPPPPASSRCRPYFTHPRRAWTPPLALDQAASWKIAALHELGLGIGLYDFWGNITSI